MDLEIIAYYKGIDGKVRAKTIPPGGCVARWNKRNSAYLSLLDHTQPTADYRLFKVISGKSVLIGQEAIDLSPNIWQNIVLEVSGSTIRAYRAKEGKQPIPTITATDSDLTYGYFGIRKVGGCPIPLIIRKC